MIVLAFQTQIDDFSFLLHPIHTYCHLILVPKPQVHSSTFLACHDNLPQLLNHFENAKLMPKPPLFICLYVFLQLPVYSLSMEKKAPSLVLSDKKLFQRVDELTHEEEWHYQYYMDPLDNLDLSQYVKVSQFPQMEYNDKEMNQYGDENGVEAKKDIKTEMVEPQLTKANNEEVFQRIGKQDGLHDINIDELVHSVAD
jgi:hypothetical protein